MRLLATIDVTDGPGAELLARLPERVTDALRAAGAEGEATAKVLAPVDTGYLRNSIGHDLVEPGVAMELTAAAHYAVYVELGTRHMAARPFMAPAAVAARQGFEDAARRYLGGTL